MDKEDGESSQMVPIDITPETAKFFFSMFHGRVDVYAKRSKNGYYAVCQNRWKSGLCPKVTDSNENVWLSFVQTDDSSIL